MRKGRSDWDFNNYDSQHMVSHHPRMTEAQVMRAYREAYRTFYSVKNTLWSLLTRYRVAGLSAIARHTMVRQWLYYFYSYRAGRHPMLGGLWQRRVKRAATCRGQRRAGRAVPVCGRRQPRRGRSDPA